MNLLSGLNEDERPVMGSGRTYNKAPKTRPKKSAGARRRREKLHRLRLVALGMDAEEVRKLTSKKMRELLQRPAKLKAS